MIISNPPAGEPSFMEVLPPMTADSSFSIAFCRKSSLLAGLDFACGFKNHVRALAAGGIHYGLSGVRRLWVNHQIPAEARLMRTARSWGTPSLSLNK